MNKAIKYGMYGFFGFVGLSILLGECGYLVGDKNAHLSQSKATKITHAKMVSTNEPSSSIQEPLPKLRSFVIGDKFTIQGTFPCHLWPSYEAIHKNDILMDNYNGNHIERYISYRHTVVLPVNTPGTVIKWVKRDQFGSVAVMLKNHLLIGWVHAYHMQAHDKNVIGYGS